MTALERCGEFLMSQQRQISTSSAFSSNWAWLKSKFPAHFDQTAERALLDSAKLEGGQTSESRLCISVANHDVAARLQSSPYTNILSRIWSTSTGHVVHQVIVLVRTTDGVDAIPKEVGKKPDRVLRNNSKVVVVKLGLAERAVFIQDFYRAHHRITVKACQHLLAGLHGVKVSVMLEAGAAADILLPRQIAMYLAKTLTPRTSSEIGDMFNGFSHTTVMHAVRKIEALRATNEKLNSEIQLYIDTLNGLRAEQVPISEVIKAP